MDFISLLGKRATDVMNLDLGRDFTEEEVNGALKRMNPHKAPGLGGMPPIFYQQYWNIVGSSMTMEILFALNTS